jgi:hypothetical protein
MKRAPEAANQVQKAAQSSGTVRGEENMDRTVEPLIGAATLDGMRQREAPQLKEVDKLNTIDYT